MKEKISQIYLLVITITKFISQNIKQIIFWFGIIIAAVYIINIIRVMMYERKINKLNKDKQKEIENIKKRSGIDIHFLQGTIKQIEEKYFPKIEELERKRRFILDKLPFIKK